MTMKFSEDGVPKEKENSSENDIGDQQFPIRSKGAIYQAIAQARASLRDPTRPFTPADRGRHLFTSTEYGTARPTSSYNIGSTNFAQSKPLRAKAAKSGSPDILVVSHDAGAAAAADGKDMAETHLSLVDSIDLLVSTLNPQTEVATLVQVCDQIWSSLEKVDWSCIPPEQQMVRKEAILNHLSMLMDIRHPVLLIKLCRIALKVTTGGPSLLSACKLLFKLSKKESNDTHFRDNRIMEPLLAILAAPNQLNCSFEVLVYAAGVLKNISNDTENQRLMSQHGAIAALSNLLQLQHTPASLKTPRGLPEPLSGNREERVGQLMVQVTGTLRNLAVNASNRKQFVVYRTVDNLCSLLDTQSSHVELMLNASRVLSKLTLHEDIRMVVDNNTRYLGSMLKVLQLHGDNQPLVIRVCFILGNLTSGNDHNRAVLVDEYGALDVLCPLLRRLCEREREVKAEGTEGLAEVQDLLIKLIRLVAHLAMHVDIGPRITTLPAVEDLVTLLETVAIEDNEELILNVVSCLTNLSYYEAEGNVVSREQLRVSRALVPILMHPNHEAIIESARAFGNFSRSQEARDMMVAQRVDEALLLLLGHSNEEVLHAVAGVVMNLAGDPHHQHCLHSHDGVQRLIDALEHAVGASAPSLVVLLCKTLFNSSLSQATCFSMGEHAAIIGLVESYLQAHPGQLEALRSARAAGPADEEPDDLLEALEVATHLLKVLSENPPEDGDLVALAPSLDNQ